MAVSLTYTDTIIWGADMHITQIPEDDLATFSEHLRKLCHQYPEAPFIHAGDHGWQRQGAIPVMLLEAELAGIKNPRLCICGNHDLLPTDLAKTLEYIRSIEPV